MATLEGLRADLAQKVAATGLDATDHLPEVITPPLVLVGPDEPYIEFEDAVYGSVWVNHIIAPIVAGGDNDLQAAEIDQAIVRLLAADLGDWFITRVASPGPVVINGQSYLAGPVHVRIEARLEVPGATEDEEP